MISAGVLLCFNATNAALIVVRSGGGGGDSIAQSNATAVHSYGATGAGPVKRRRGGDSGSGGAHARAAVVRLNASAVVSAVGFAHAGACSACQRARCVALSSMQQCMCSVCVCSGRACFKRPCVRPRIGSSDARILSHAWRRHGANANCPCLQPTAFTSQHTIPCYGRDLPALRACRHVGSHGCGDSAGHRRVCCRHSAHGMRGKV
jgi:hypothetical protein